MTTQLGMIGCSVSINCDLRRAHMESNCGSASAVPSLPMPWTEKVAFEWDKSESILCSFAFVGSHAPRDNRTPRADEARNADDIATMYGKRCCYPCALRFKGFQGYKLYNKDVQLQLICKVVTCTKDAYRPRGISASKARLSSNYQQFALDRCHATMFFPSCKLRICK